MNLLQYRQLKIRFRSSMSLCDMCRVTEAEGRQQVAELRAAIKDEAPRVAGVAAHVRHRHAHVDDAQGVHLLDNISL